MPSAYETAYPRLKSSLSDEELNRSHAPTERRGLEIIL